MGKRISLGLPPPWAAPVPRVAPGLVLIVCSTPSRIYEFKVDFRSPLAAGTFVTTLDSIFEGFRVVLIDGVGSARPDESYGVAHSKT